MYIHCFIFSEIVQSVVLYVNSYQYASILLAICPMIMQDDCLALMDWDNWHLERTRFSTWKGHTFKINVKTFLKVEK